MFPFSTIMRSFFCVCSRSDWLWLISSISGFWQQSTPFPTTRDLQQPAQTNQIPSELIFRLHNIMVEKNDMSSLRGWKLFHIVQIEIGKAGKSHLQNKYRNNAPNSKMRHIERLVLDGGLPFKTLPNKYSFIKGELIFFLWSWIKNVIESTEQMSSIE